jgi:hypothetical protein
MDRSEYLAERKLLIDAEAAAAASFDKAMLTLSAGALGLSVTFTKDLVKAPEAPWLLILAWVAYVASLMSTLVSFLLSQAAMRSRRDEWDASYGQCEKPPENHLDRWTKCLNVGSILLFAAGTIVLIAYSAVNLRR